MRATLQRLSLPLLLLSALPGCSAPSTQAPSADGSTSEMAEAASAGRETAPEAASAPAPDTVGTPPGQMASSAVTYRDGQRQFIRTARAEFRVDDVYRAALAIEDLVAAQGGFVASNEITADTRDTRRRPSGDGKLVELTEYVVRGRLTVRVPSANTQAFLRAIAAQMAFLDQRRFEAADAQFQLLRQQLAFQRSEQAQQALGDAVAQGGRIDRSVQATQARGDAMASRDEALVARREFEDRVAFSTLELAMYQTPQVRRTELTDVEAVFRQGGPGFFARVGHALRAGWTGALDALVALATWWPLVLLVVVTVAAWRRIRLPRR